MDKTQSLDGYRVRIDGKLIGMFNNLDEAEAALERQRRGGHLRTASIIGKGTARLFLEDFQTGDSGVTEKVWVQAGG